MTSPILKWAGGKRQLLDNLFKRFPEISDREETAYHEPFLGGGALFFDYKPYRGTVNDLNTRLHNFYIQVLERPDDFIERCQQFDHPENAPDSDEEFSKTGRSGREIKNYYYQQRELFNSRPNDETFDSLDEAARLLYLNRTCFNGLYRENSDGEFNVPIGSYKNPNWVRAEQVQQCSKVLQRFGSENVRNEDFSYITDAADSGDVVYFDPPYEPVSPTADFSQYSAEDFGRDDQRRLWDVAKQLAENDVHVIISNSAVMEGIYEGNGFYVDLVGATRVINSDAQNRDEVDEIIATTVSPEDRRSYGEQTLADF